jgi:hypothetical protein
MFGPAHTFDREMALRQMNLAGSKAVRQEVIEISTWWPKELRLIASEVMVPVDYTMGQYDALWQVTQETVRDFGAAFVNSPRVQADIVPDVGHCIEHHLRGGGLHARQLAFAAACFEGRNLE